MESSYRPLGKRNKRRRKTSSALAPAAIAASRAWNKKQRAAGVRGDGEMITKISQLVGGFNPFEKY